MGGVWDSTNPAYWWHDGMEDFFPQIWSAKNPPSLFRMDFVFSAAEAEETRLSLRV